MVFSALQISSFLPAAYNFNNFHFYFSIFQRAYQGIFPMASTFSSLLHLLLLLSLAVCSCNARPIGVIKKENQLGRSEVCNMFSFHFALQNLFSCCLMVFSYSVMVWLLWSNWLSYSIKYACYEHLVWISKPQKHSMIVLIFCMN